MADLNIALYYPSMEFQDTGWLKGMTLFWDGIRRIVPSTYIPEDDDDVKAFIDAGIIDSIDPRADAASIAQEFQDNLDSSYKGACALDMGKPSDDPMQYRIHPEKVDARLRELLSSKQISRMTKDWIEVSEDFGRFYMLYLAKAMAEKRGLAKITDSEEAWTATSYFDYEGSLDGYPNFEVDKNIATLMLRNFIPENIDDIPTESIINFREKHRDERRHFIGSVRDFVSRISDIDDSKIILEATREYQKDIESAVKEFRESLGGLKFTSLVGIKTISFPIAANIAAITGSGTFDYSVLSTATGLALGLLTSYVNYREKKKQLIKESDFSYLYFIRSSFDNWHYDGGGLNYHLYRNIEEFIND